MENHMADDRGGHGGHGLGLGFRLSLAHGGRLWRPNKVIKRHEHIMEIPMADDRGGPTKSSKVMKMSWKITWRTTVAAMAAMGIPLKKTD